MAENLNLRAFFFSSEKDKIPCDFNWLRLLTGNEAVQCNSNPSNIYHQSKTL